MNRTLLTLAMASLFAAGCGHTPAPKAASSPAAKARAKAAEARVEKHAKAAAEPEAASKAEADRAAAPEADPRKPGDFVVYRFSGSFRRAPITLTQRIVERTGSVITIDVVAESGEQKRELRVKVNDAPATKGEVISVARLEGGVEAPASVDAYEALLAETTLAADQNEAFLGAEDVVLDVGGAPMPCHKASYRVRVGKREATLQTLSSDGFAWGDVGGEITAANGKVLYRAEVVEVGHTEGQGPAVAHAAP